jgi:hypothetical protein
MSVRTAILRNMTHFNLTMVGEAKDIPFSELPPKRSLHTGRQLRRVELAFTVTGEQINDAILKELSDAQDTSHSLQGEGKGWLQNGNDY